MYSGRLLNWVLSRIRHRPPAVHDACLAPTLLQFECMGPSNRHGRSLRAGKTRSSSGCHEIASRWSRQPCMSGRGFSTERSLTES